MATGRSENLSGKKFGLLTAKSIARRSPSGHTYWLCQCDCGGSKTVRASHLKSGNVRSCGCIPAHKSHGKRHTRIYNIWAGMKQRCYNPNNPEYVRYGGRGITICEEWRDNFEAFLGWALANGYAKNLTIDRQENDGPYSPRNCRWATAGQQANNTRKTRMLTYNGETHSVSEWAKILGVNQSTLNMRLNKYHWSVEDTLGKEVKKNVP